MVTPEYVSQQGSLYADCLPRVMVNACRFFGIPHPDPDLPEEWEPVMDFAGCRAGGATAGEYRIAKYFGLGTDGLHSSQIVGSFPALLTVYNPEVGHDLHAVLVVAWEGETATVVNYRTEGPTVERVPLVPDLHLPRTKDGALDRRPRWEGMALALYPNNRHFHLVPFQKEH